MTLPLIEVPKGLETAAFILGENILDSVPEFLQTFFPGKKPWIIADGNTWNAAGKKVFELLKKAGMDPAEPYLFPANPRPHPDYAISRKLAGLMPENSVPVAVGSGVINDLVKCTAGLKNEKYCCVATACSVDGYTSNGGAMTVDGTKMTIRCPAPYAICADVKVLRTAPAPMFAAGYADLLAKIPGGADWIIADRLGIEPIRKDIWALIQIPLRDQLADASDMGKVFAGLAATGYGMQMYRESRPASGAEHLFSHVWEMEGLKYQGEDVSHGFKVGVGTMISTLLMEYVIHHDFDSLRSRMKQPLSLEERKKEIDVLMAKGCYGEAPRETALKKYLTPEETLKRRALIASKWTEIQKGLKKQIYPFEELQSMLKKAHCPTLPEEIGLSREQFFHAIPAAHLIRVRYTILDLLYECGLLDDACEELKKKF